MANGKSIARSGLALCVVFGLLCGAAYSQVPPGYYDEVNGKTGQALRDALHEIIDDHQVIPYSSSSFDTHDAMCNLDEDPLNPLNVILVYSGYSVAKSTWPDWNREHLWPASYGVDLGPAKSDLFSLNPCDMNVNSSRGNKYFDEGGTSFHPEAPECRYDFDSWEPRDIEKGDLARAMFYMDVRYSGDQSDELDLELTDDVNLIQSGSRYMGRLSTLLAWHEADPVDDRERARCEGIYALYQGNRNPFVDHPSWVYAIWGGKLSTDTYSFRRRHGRLGGFRLECGTGPGKSQLPALRRVYRHVAGVAIARRPSRPAPELGSAHRTGHRTGEYAHVSGFYGESGRRRRGVGDPEPAALARRGGAHAGLRVRVEQPLGFRIQSR